MYLYVARDQYSMHVSLVLLLLLVLCFKVCDNVGGFTADGFWKLQTKVSGRPKRVKICLSLLF